MLPEKVRARACTVTGCIGTMYLHGPIEDLPPPAHLEFPRYATWVCAENPAHVELLTLREWAEYSRVNGRTDKRKPERGWFARWVNYLRRSADRAKDLGRPIRTTDPQFGALRYLRDARFWEGHAFFSPIGTEVEVLIPGEPSGPAEEQRAFFNEIQTRYASLWPEVLTVLETEARRLELDSREFVLVRVDLPGPGGGADRDWALSPQGRQTISTNPTISRGRSAAAASEHGCHHDRRRAPPRLSVPR